MVVMGKSWGGEHALRYASKRAGVVSKLVLVAPMGAGDAPSDWRGHGPAVIPALLLYADDDTSFAKVQVQSSHLMPQYTACTSRNCVRIYAYPYAHCLARKHAHIYKHAHIRNGQSKSGNCWDDCRNFKCTASPQAATPSALSLRPSLRPL